MKAMDQNALDTLLNDLKAWCRTHPVRLCVLFGSQATGRARPDSDVDLAVWPEEPWQPLTKLAWIGELEDLLMRPVGLVIVTPDLDPVLGFEIVRDGRLVFEREEGLWPVQAARLWHLYNDSLPFRRAAREQLRRFAEQVRRGA
jgi:predicted nucleotidyltransferase